MKWSVEPGSWERDEHGKHFRRVGNTIEYMPTVTTPYGEFEVGSVPPPPKIVEAERPKTWGECPFLSKCTAQCALYGERGCGLVTGEATTTGKRCPFAEKHHIFSCTEKCALWKMCNRKEKMS